MSPTDPCSDGRAGRGERDRRWNFAVLVAEACAFMAGLAFFDGSTVLPTVLARLGASDAVIGMTRLMATLGYTLPALFASHYVHGRAYHKSFLLVTCGASRLGLITLPFVLLWVAPTRPALALVWVLILVSGFWALDGACAVSWFDIVAKCVHERVRGRFFGVMQMLCGILAIGAGVLVQRILSPKGLPYPAGFALLGALWCAGALLSQVGLMAIREPAGDVDRDEQKPGFAEYLRQAVPFLQRNPAVARLVAVRVLLDGAGVAGPFYVLFAQRDLHVSIATVGLYGIALNLGRLAMGPVWGWTADRFGSAAGVRAVSLAVVAAPAAGLAASASIPWLLPVAFFLMGATMDGVWMIMSTALLKMVQERDRPRAVGLATVCQTPSAIYGPLGGLLAQTTSYRVVFMVALGFAAAGTTAAFRYMRSSSPPSDES